jgi:hypothetical protein
MTKTSVSPMAGSKTHAAIKGTKHVLRGLVMAAAIFPHHYAAANLTPVNLRSASSFAVLAGAGFTVAGPVSSTTTAGDIGTSPTPSMTGLGNGVLNGANHTPRADSTFLLLSSALAILFPLVLCATKCLPAKFPWADPTRRRITFRWTCGWMKWPWSPRSESQRQRTISRSS